MKKLMTLRSKFVNLPEAVKTHYDAEANRYINLTEYMKSERDEGKAEGKAEGKIEEKREIARSLLEQGAPRKMIEKATGLSEQELTALQDL